jgi:hypothetical protein
LELTSNRCFLLPVDKSLALYWQRDGAEPIWDKMIERIVSQGKNSRKIGHNDWKLIHNIIPSDGK